MPLPEGPPVGAAAALADQRIAAALAAPGAAERPAGGAGRVLEIDEIAGNILGETTLGKRLRPVEEVPKIYSFGEAEALLKSIGMKIPKGEGKQDRMLAALLEAGLVLPGSKVKKGGKNKKLI